MPIKTFSQYYFFLDVPVYFTKDNPERCAEVGRVPKNCTQIKVKVLLEIFTQAKVSLNSYLSKSKKVLHKKTT